MAHGALPVLGYVGENPPRISTLRDVEVAPMNRQPRALPHA
jgi:hypothetical protein